MLLAILQSKNYFGMTVITVYIPTILVPNIL